MKKYFENEINYKHFLRVVNSWIGTPYRHLTMVKGRGVDCALFLGAIMKGSGIIDQVVYDYYPRCWHIHTDTEYVLEGIERHIKENLKEGLDVERYNLGEVELFRGDILTFSLTNNNNISNHSAYYLEGNEMVHSLERIGVHKVGMMNYFLERLTNVFRLMEKT